MNQKTESSTSAAVVVRWQAQLPWLLPVDQRMLGEILSSMTEIVCELGKSIGTTELLLVDDGYMDQLNARFMGCQGPTNILSFPSDGFSPGMLALSPVTLAREARIFQIAPVDYLLRLLAHGLGHLAGFEHGEEMEKFCGELLTEAISRTPWLKRLTA